MAYTDQEDVDKYSLEANERNNTGKIEGKYENGSIDCLFIEPRRRIMPFRISS